MPNMRPDKRNAAIAVVFLGLLGALFWLTGWSEGTALGRAAIWGSGCWVSRSSVESAVVATGPIGHFGAQRTITGSSGILSASTTRVPTNSSPDSLATRTSYRPETKTSSRLHG